MYFFVNRRLMLDETELPDDVLTVDLHLIQAKNESGFGEVPIQKMQSFVNDLLTYTKLVSSFTYYNQVVRDAITRFRDKYENILGQPHSFSINFSYATKSDQGPNINVLKRKDDLVECVKEHVSSANVQFDFLGARHLTAAFRNPPNRTLMLDIVQQIMVPEDGSIVCLARLDKFAEFLTDEKGALREYLLEPNVRDYAGRRNPVNKAIREAIESSDVKEFWWLNNGITILAEKCGVAAGKVEIVAPELVNGLQTSHEVFNHFSKNKQSDQRMVLVRVILPPDEQTRRRIIKATNNQTPVNPLSLHATEDIHFDIEELLKLYDIYYDRRKGEYRRLRKPISKIISIKYLAQTVIAIAAQQPNDARARPMSILGKEDGYERIFDVQANKEMFLACILLDRQVESYLSGRDDLTKDIKNDIHFYMDTWLACHLSKSANPEKSKIAALAKVVKLPVPVHTMDDCCSEIVTLYNEHGGDDTAAKGGEMVISLKTTLEATFS